MKFYEVRKYLSEGKNIFDLPLNVTFYARVSTESDEQLNSLDNQITFFKDLIIQNKNWHYIDGYIDEGLSGSSVKKRKNFLKMIDDAKKGKFDLIITKEVSRFSRNLLDSIKYTQELMLNDVGVYFQSNGINTYDANSEFILNMMGSVAQEEVKRLSSRIKWGHKEAIKKGHVLGSNKITGYQKNHTKLIICDEEAFKVKKIFELYATGSYGLYKLALILHKMGINNSKGNIYDKETLKNIISNPKYKGFYRGHTTEVIDYKTKKRINIPTHEQVIYQDEKIPQIVSVELWNRANKILGERSKLMTLNKGNAKKIESRYPYTSKIYCKDHNKPYQRMMNKNPRWACSNYVRYRSTSCLSPIIKEEDLNNLFFLIIHKLFNQKDIINEMEYYYQNVDLNSINQKEINSLNQEIKSIINKKEKLLELNIDGSINNIEFKERNNKYNKNIEVIKSKINSIQNEMYEDKNNNIKKHIVTEINNQELINMLIHKFLDIVYVEKTDGNRHDLILNIFMNLNNKDYVKVDKFIYKSKLNRYKVHLFIK